MSCLRNSQMLSKIQVCDLFYANSVIIQHQLLIPVSHCLLASLICCKCSAASNNSAVFVLGTFLRPCLQTMSEALRQVSICYIQSSGMGWGLIMPLLVKNQRPSTLLCHWLSTSSQNVQSPVTHLRPWQPNREEANKPSTAALSVSVSMGWYPRVNVHCCLTTISN